MSVHLRPETKRYYCKYYVEGRKSPVKVYCGKGKQGKLKAVQYDAMIKEAKQNGRRYELPYGLPEPQQKKEITFAELTKLYFADKAPHWRQKSRDNFEYFMRAYVLDYMGHKLCSEITMSDITELRAYIRHASKRNAQENSVNRYITSTKAVFGWGVTFKHIEVNPWAAYKKPKENVDHPDLITVDELRHLINCSAPHLGWAMQVAYYTGSRPGETELFKLEYKDVDWEGGRLLIRSTKTKPRWVLLKDEFLMLLKEKQATAQTGYIIEYQGKPVKQLKTSLKMALKQSGMKKKFRLYDIRHLYARTMARNGGDMRAIQSLMGHSSLDMTMVYAGNEDEQERREAVNTLPPLRIVPKTVPKIGEGDNAIALTP